jgi:hypothetical protein
MKKLLVLILVLGLCSVANATISLRVNGSEVGTSASVTVTDVIGVYSTDSSVYLALVLTDTPANDLANGAITTNAGDWGNITAYSLSGYGDGYYMTADYSGTPPSAGIQFTMNVSGSIDDTFQIQLWHEDDWVNTADTLDITIIPEPMTIALLGLGGLFLRRRR